MSTSYTQKAIAGFSWQSVLKICIYASTAVKIFVLARLLTPDDFGLFSLVMIAFGVSESVTQTGVNLTIIQSKHSINYFLNTAWVIAIIRGFIIGIIMLSLGILLSKYFQKPELLLMTSLAAIVPIIKGFINPAIVKLHKEMLFSQDTLYRLSLNLAEVIFAITIAFFFHSVYALIWAIVAAAIFEVIISFVFFTEKPIWQYLPSRAKIIFANARWLSLATILNYLNENADDFLIGKMLGTHNLGIYHNAYALSHKANYELAKSIHHANMPIYTRIVHDLKRLARAFKKSIGATFLVTLAVSLPLLIFPKQLITLLLGEKWLEAIPLIRPLVLAGLVQSLTMSSYTLFLARKAYQKMNFHLFISLTLMITLIWQLGSKLGPSGAVLGILIARSVSLPIVIWGVKDEI